MGAEGRRQLDPMKLRRPRQRRSHFERQTTALPGNDPRDRGVAVQNRQRSSCAYLAQMLAEMALQVGDAYIRHSHIIVIYGHQNKTRSTARSAFREFDEVEGELAKALRRRRETRVRLECRSPIASPLRRWESRV